MNTVGDFLKNAYVPVLLIVCDLKKFGVQYCVGDRPIVVSFVESRSQ